MAMDDKASGVRPFAIEITVLHLEEASGARLIAIEVIELHFERVSGGQANCN